MAGRGLLLLLAGAGALPGAEAFLLPIARQVRTVGLHELREPISAWLLAVIPQNMRVAVGSRRSRRA
jgi:hypothetical protein